MRFFDCQDYTGEHISVKEAVEKKSLPTAVDVEGEKVNLQVLVTPEDTTPLLGVDHLQFQTILLEKSEEERYESSRAGEFRPGVSGRRRDKSSRRRMKPQQ